MKSKSKSKYIWTTVRQIKNCTANKAISTTDAVRRIDRRTKTDKKTDNQTDGMTTRNQTDSIKATCPPFFEEGYKKNHILLWTIVELLKAIKHIFLKFNFFFIIFRILL